MGAGHEEPLTLYERSNGSHGRCVSRRRRRLIHAFKKPPVATERIRTIMAGGEAGATNQPELFGGLDRSWSGKCREGDGFGK